LNYRCCSFTHRTVLLRYCLVFVSALVLRCYYRRSTITSSCPDFIPTSARIRSSSDPADDAGSRTRRGYRVTSRNRGTSPSGLESSADAAKSYRSATRASRTSNRRFALSWSSRTWMTQTPSAWSAGGSGRRLAAPFRFGLVPGDDGDDRAAAAAGCGSESMSVRPPPERAADDWTSVAGPVDGTGAKSTSMSVLMHTTAL
jgi:hypothetical protein